MGTVASRTLRSRRVCIFMSYSSQKGLATSIQQEWCNNSQAGHWLAKWTGKHRVNYKGPTMFWWVVHALPEDTICPQRGPEGRESKGRCRLFFKTSGVWLQTQQAMQCVFLSGQILVFFPPSLGHTVIFSVLRSQWLVVDWGHGPALPSTIGCSNMFQPLTRKVRLLLHTPSPLLGIQPLGDCTGVHRCEYRMG